MTERKIRIIKELVEKYRESSDQPINSFEKTLLDLFVEEVNEIRPGEDRKAVRQYTTNIVKIRLEEFEIDTRPSGILPQIIKPFRVLENGRKVFAGTSKECLDYISNNYNVYPLI